MENMINIVDKGVLGCPGTFLGCPGVSWSVLGCPGVIRCTRPYRRAFMKIRGNWNFHLCPIALGRL